MILETVAHPQAIKRLSLPELGELASDIRAQIIDVVSKTGGHLASNLGVVELTIALHFVFDSPIDKLLFDVGHQAYPHKLLTGRRDRFSSLRQMGGLSGFSDPKESIHDHFYAGHAGNALSLAIGMAKNRDLRGKKGHILPFLGDASLTCGLTLEAMNNIPHELKNFIIVLNDNAMSISKNVGAITKILSHFFRTSTGADLYKELSAIFSQIPLLQEVVHKREAELKKSLQRLLSTASFFEQFGVSYVGPVDGHDIKKLIETFESVKGCQKPTLVHVLTIKGKGMRHAMSDPTPYHGAKPFDPATGIFHLAKSADPTFPEIFGAHMSKLADLDPRLVSITPAMPAGSCLEELMKKHPDRCIDVGIAEGHSVTYAAGMGAEGKLRIVCCIYSTFLQRAFDNIYHDVCVQNIPVVFAIDRSGLACGDGVTAQGLYDISFLQAMPHLVITQPRNGDLLKALLESAFSWNCPVAIRYPNLKTTQTEREVEKREIGKGEILADGEDLVLLPLGHMYTIAFEVRENLLQKGIEAAIIDPVFIKPLDEKLLLSYFTRVSHVVTIEEHALQGGFGSIINSFICTQQLTHLKILNFGLPDLLIEQGSHAALLQKWGLDAFSITEKILKILFPAKEAAAL